MSRVKRWNAWTWRVCNSHEQARNQLVFSGAYKMTVTCWCTTFGGENDCNLLLYSFRGQSDCNSLLYLTIKCVLENFGGELLPGWWRSPPLVAGLVTSKRVSFLSQLRRISPHNAHKWHNTFIGHNSTQHTHRAQQHTTHSQGTAAARRSAEANTAPPSSSNPRSAFQRNWKSSPPRFPSGADERERPLVTSQALDPETKGRNSVFANTQVISCVMFE